MNRVRLSVIEARIERAEEWLRGYLTLSGLVAAVCGAFEVAIENDAVQVSQLPGPEARQLALPNGVNSSQCAVDAPPSP